MLYSIINVYMPNNYLEKVECWRSLQDLANENSPQNLIIVGDFNTTRGLKEKRGGTIVRGQFREKMDDLILDLYLFDVPPSKGLYTWNNRRVGPGHNVARLDRFLIRNSFLAHPDKAYSLILLWERSDHRPISLLFEPQKNWGPIPFRCNPLWMGQSDFLPSISQVWN
jgi:exonuclease III